MMKADVTRQMVRFMETDLPEKKQIDLTVPQMCGERAVISMDHVVVTGFDNAAELIFSDVARSVPTDSIVNPDNPEFVENPHRLELPSNLDKARTVTVDRAKLVKLLSALTSEFVKIRVRSDYPLLLCGEIGEQTAAAAIAPRIEND